MKKSDEYSQQNLFLFFIFYFCMYAYLHVKINKYSS